MTSYSVDPGGAQVVKNSQTLVNGAGADTPATVMQKISYGDANTFRRGLVTAVETWGQTTPGQYALRRTAQMAWTQDDESLAYQLNPRVKVSAVSDPQGNQTGTSYEYTSYGLVTEAREWSVSYAPLAQPVEVMQWNGVNVYVLRRAHTEYNLAPAYTSRRVIGLVSSVSVYDDRGQVASKVDYTYDQGGEFLRHQGEPVQHDGANYGSTFVVGRGLVTSIRRWDVTALHDISKSVESRAGYNTTGSVIFSRDPLGHSSSISYADRFTDKAGTNTLAYPTSVTDAGNNTSKVEYGFHTGLVSRTEDPKRAQQTFTYDAVGRTVRAEVSGRDAATGQVVNGGYTRWVYSDAMDAVQSCTQVDVGKPEVCSISVVDGAGRVRATAADFPGSQGGYRARYTAYDIAGRVSKQSNPAEANGLWNPYGDDSAGWVWTQQTYDWKSRPLVTTNTDGTTIKNSYGGCGCAGGEVATTKGGVVQVPDTSSQGRRTQNAYRDAFGRTWKTEVLNWDGTVYSSTTVKFNALGQTVRVRRYAGAAPSPEPASDAGAYQTATMSYDGHGRLKIRHDPWQVNANNQPLATSYDYNADDTVHKVTDARAASITYDYNSRHLPLTVTYGAPSGSNIAVPPSVTYTYDEVGSHASMTTANGAGGSVTYVYDGFSRLTSEARQFPGLSGTYTLAYQYTLSGALKSVTDQTNAASPVSFSYDFDSAGQVTKINSTGMGATAPLASNAKYRAWGALKSTDYGNGTSAAFGYDGRGQVTSYTLGGVKDSSTGQVRPEGGSFQYYPDSRLKFATDYLSNAQSGGIQDRSYAYDHAGRLLNSLTGTDARNFIGGTTSNVNDGPYRQAFTHNE